MATLTCSLFVLYCAVVLRIIGKYWEVLGSVGKCWEVLGSVGKYWEVLGSVGKCWEVLGLRKISQTLPNLLKIPNYTVGHNIFIAE